MASGWPRRAETHSEWWDIIPVEQGYKWPRINQYRHPRRCCSASPAANFWPLRSDIRAPPGTLSLLLRIPTCPWRKSARVSTFSGRGRVVVTNCSLRLSTASRSGVVPSLRACSANARSISGVSGMFIGRFRLCVAVEDSTVYIARWTLVSPSRGRRMNRTPCTHTWNSTRSYSPSSSSTLPR